MTRDAWLRDASYSASIICSRFGDATPLPGRGDTPPGIVLSSGGEEVLLGNLNNYTCYSYTCYNYTCYHDNYTCYHDNYTCYHDNGKLPEEADMVGEMDVREGTRLTDAIFLGATRLTLACRRVSVNSKQGNQGNRAKQAR